MRGVVLAMMLSMAGTAVAASGPAAGDWADANFARETCGNDLECHATVYKTHRSTAVWAALTAVCGEVKTGLPNRRSSNQLLGSWN
jgi:hypothetical protein